MLNIKNCTRKEFFTTVGKRVIYAFGAAAQPRNFVERNPEYHLEMIINAFSDNNDEKWGKEYELNGMKIPIISPDKMYSYIKKEDVILITSRFYVEIIESLDKIPQLDGIDCYILTYIERVREQIDARCV